MTKLVDALQQQLVQRAAEPTLKNVAEHDWLTGTAVANLINEVKAAMRARDLHFGDVVLLALENDKRVVILEQALFELGIIAHPIAPSSGKTIIQNEFAEYHYQAMIIEETLTAAFDHDENFHQETFTIEGAMTYNFFRYRHAQASTGEDQAPTEQAIALMLNTSGTTGKPKRVGLTHAQVYHAAVHIGQSQGLSATDTNMLVMPVFHINAQLISILGTRVSGGRLVVAPKFSAREFWRQVATHQVTWVSIVPTIIGILQMNANALAEYTKYQDAIQLQYVRSASFSLPEERWRAFEATFGVPVLEGYGMTEAASLITLNPKDHPKIGTVGLPVATDIALLHDGEITKDAHQVGEILLRGEHVITDYVDSNPASFIDGWLKTGDVGRFDDDGYLAIVGRIKEIINHGGEKVAPAAIEATLSKLPFIQEVIVVGTPHPLYGEEVTAVVISRETVLSEDEQTAQIKAYAASELSKPERPTTVIYVTDYPRNPTGKVLRHQLIAEIKENALEENV
ncbi:AMP-binding protein [Weissella soli]|uniref:AMP-binding protein n=1 Tax=Weissella soli TaxID=155866 RepID=UPI00359F7575